MGDTANEQGSLSSIVRPLCSDPVHHASVRRMAQELHANPQVRTQGCWRWLLTGPALPCRLMKKKRCFSYPPEMAN